MNKAKIRIVKIGQQRNEVLFDRLKKYKSDIFTVDIFQVGIPNPDYGWGYSFKALHKVLADNANSKYDLCIGFLDYEIEDNLYGICLNENNSLFVLSFYQGLEFLQGENIDPLNYILGAIYRFTTEYLLGDRLDHDETRGCLFDMMGYKRDIVISARKPSICQECETKIKLKSRAIPDDYLILLQRELKKIKKQNYYLIADFIKGHPYLSLFLAFVSGVIANIISSGIYDLLKGAF